MPTKRSPLFLTSQSRVWIIPNRAGPGNAPEYQSYARGGGFSWNQGGVNPVRGPSDEEFGKFVVLATTQEQAELPQLNIEWRSTRQRSEVLALLRGGCPFDVQIHIGTCRSPLDFDFGAEKVIVLEGGHLDTYAIPDLGAFDKDQEAPGQENSQITGQDWYEVLPIIGNEVAAAEVINPIVAINICDSRSCGECGISSNGCQIIFAVAQSTGGSPGLSAQVLVSQDGGATWTNSIITTMAAPANPSGGACVGTNYAVIVGGAADAIHYAPIQDLLDGDEEWTAVTTGFVGAGSPNAIFSLGRVFTWIVGDGGYIYFSSDITAGVEVQSAGSITTQNLAAIHGIDRNNLLAVGANNVVVNTANGGLTWSLITGPAAGVALTACAMLSEGEWYVGTATGLLYYTVNSGRSWTQKAFSGQGSGAVNDLKFSTPTVGYMAHAGRVLRTKNGGYSWYVLPETEGLTFPAATSYDALAACEDDQNLVFAGGTRASDGVLVKAA